MKYMAKKITIGLVGHSYSRGNFGLCALAFGEQFAIEKACDKAGVDYEIISFETGINDPCNDSPKVKIEEYDLRNIFKTSRQFSKCDLIFDITGGDSFSDIYGLKLFFVNYFIKIAVMLSGVPYISAPQTYGPFYRKWIRLLSNIYLSKACEIYGRDEQSGNALNKSNSKRIKCVADLGFALPYIQQEKFGRPTVGFNVNGLVYQSKNIHVQGSYYQELCDRIITLVKESGYDVVLIPHVLGPEKIDDNDYYVSVELAKKHNLPDPPFFKSPKEVKGYISRCHFFIGSRMHATIAAVSSGVPTLPLAYSRKFKGVFSPIGYNHTLDLKTSSNQDILYKLRNMLGDNIKQMKSDTEKANIVVSEKTKLYINCISNAIENIK